MKSPQTQEEISKVVEGQMTEANKNLAAALEKPRSPRLPVRMSPLPR